ncbi:hypothetical protein ACWEU9_04480 [Staphylococcus xylosus]
MIRNKWKIELWFQKFSYFINKINTEFVPERITFNKYNLIKGQSLPNETVYISYFVDQPDQIIEQHTVKSDSNGTFTDEVPNIYQSEIFKNDKLSFFIDSQSKIDIDDISLEIVEEGSSVLLFLDLKTIESYFDEFLLAISDKTEFAKQTAENVIRQIMGEINLKKWDIQIKMNKNKDKLNSSSEFNKLKNEIIKNHQDLTAESYNDILISDFLTKYFVYKEKQDSHLENGILSQNKSNYFIKLINKNLIKQRKSDSQYFDIANSIKPSTHKNDSLEQSDNIDQFRQAAIGVSLYLYDKNDPYFKFIRSIANESLRRKTITVDDVIQSKERIDKFMEIENLISNNELYYKTTIEDTFHFTLFTAISDLLDELIQTLSVIIQKATEQDILASLHIISNLKQDLKNWVVKYDQKSQHIENLINGYARNSDLKSVVAKTIQMNRKLTSTIESELLSTLADYDISTFYSRYGSTSNPNDFRDTLMTQLISKFYESRFKNSKKHRNIYF